MEKTVKIKCKYYQLRAVSNGNITENLYDLRQWINDIEEMPLDQRKRNVSNIVGRLEEQVVVGDSECYVLTFMRMDEVSTVYKVKGNQPAEHVDIDVESNEHIAKNTVVLYDAENGIVMIQSNRGSYTEKSIQGYINSFFEEQVCCLLPIFDNVNFMGNDVDYLKLDVRLANIRQFEATSNSSFEYLVDGINRVEGLNAHIEIGLGYNRNAKLNSDEVRIAIADLVNNKGCVTSAKFRLSDDQKSGVYDLFDNLCNDTVVCAVNDRTGGIPFEVLAERMYDKYIYEHSRDRVLSALIN